MSYNQQQPPVGVPPPQGYPPKDAYPPPGYPVEGYAQGYPPQGYPAQSYPPQYAQPPPRQEAGFLEGWYVLFLLLSLFYFLLIIVSPDFVFLRKVTVLTVDMSKTRIFRCGSVEMILSNQLFSGCLLLVNDFLRYDLLWVSIDQFQSCRCFNSGFLWIGMVYYLYPRMIPCRVFSLVWIHRILFNQMAGNSATSVSA